MENVSLWIADKLLCYRNYAERYNRYSDADDSVGKYQSCLARLLGIAASSKI